MNDNFNFLPRIVHSDFEHSLSKSISSNIITKNTIHVKCLFHFSQIVRKQLTKTGLIKRKLNKYSIEILRNIERNIMFYKKNLY